jgi:hypothetical protein
VLELEFQEYTFNERLQETLQKLKTWTSNEEGLRKMVLYNEEVLVHLKSTNGHAMHNVFKHQQSLIDVISSPTTPYTPRSILGFIHAYAPTFISMNSDLPSTRHVINSSPSSTSIPINKGKMNGDICNINHKALSIWHPPWKWIQNMLSSNVGTKEYYYWQSKQC